MADDFDGSAWRFLRDFLQAEIDQRKSAGFDDDHEYAQMAHRALDALTALWSEADATGVKAAASERLQAEVRAMIEQMRLPGLAEHSIGAFRHGRAFHGLTEALAACDVAAGRRTLTPLQHAN